MVNLTCLSRKVVLWYGQLPPVTSLLPDFNDFANSGVLGLVCRLSLLGSRCQKEKIKRLWHWGTIATTRSPWHPGRGSQGPPRLPGDLHLVGHGDNGWYWYCTRTCRSTCHEGSFILVGFASVSRSMSHWCLCHSVCVVWKVRYADSKKKNNRADIICTVLVRVRCVHVGILPSDNFTKQKRWVKPGQMFVPAS